MSTLLLTHTASSLNHKVSEGHPEHPDRIRAMEKALSQDVFKPLVREEAPMGDIETVKLCHDESYVDEIREMSPKQGIVYIDGDTMMSPGTWEAAMRGVGGANAGVADPFEPAWAKVPGQALHAHQEHAVQAVVEKFTSLGRL